MAEKRKYATLLNKRSKMIIVRLPKWSKMLANVGRNQANSCPFPDQFWSNLAYSRSYVAEVWPNWVEFRPSLLDPNTDVDGYRCNKFFNFQLAHLGSSTSACMFI